MDLCDSIKIDFKNIYCLSIEGFRISVVTIVILPIKENKAYLKQIIKIFKIN